MSQSNMQGQNDNNLAESNNLGQSKIDYFLCEFSLFTKPFLIYFMDQSYSVVFIIVFPSNLHIVAT